jgi:hypothetical protein
LQSSFDFVLIARGPVSELLACGGVGAVEEKVLEVFRKASLLAPHEERPLLPPPEEPRAS